MEKLKQFALMMFGLFTVYMSVALLLLLLKQGETSESLIILYVSVVTMSAGYGYLYGVQRFWIPSEVLNGGLLGVFIVQTLMNHGNLARAFQYWFVVN